MADLDDLVEFIGAIIVAGIVAIFVANYLYNGTDLGSTNSALIGLGVFVFLILVFYGLIEVIVNIARKC